MNVTFLLACVVWIALVICVSTTVSIYHKYNNAKTNHLTISSEKKMYHIMGLFNRFYRIHTL
jgi:hypothetical protein